MTGDMDYYGAGEHLINGEVDAAAAAEWYPLLENKEDLQVCISGLPLVIERYGDWKTIGRITAVMLRGDTWYGKSTYELKENESFNVEMIVYEDSHILSRASVMQAPFENFPEFEEKELEQSDKAERMAKFVKWLGEDRDQMFRDREYLKEELRSLPYRASERWKETVSYTERGWVSIEWLEAEIGGILHDSH